MNIHEARFPTVAVAAAAGVTFATLQSHFHRGHVTGYRTGAGVEGGGSPGVRLGFSFCSAMEIAAAAALIDTGFAVADAYAAAALFAHIGEGGDGWSGESPAPIRQPGFPFHHRLGSTYLAARRREVQVLLSPADKPLSLREALHPFKGRGAVIDATALFVHVATVLEIGHPFAILDEVYAAPPPAAPAADKRARAAILG